MEGTQLQKNREDIATHLAGIQLKYWEYCDLNRVEYLDIKEPEPRARDFSEFTVEKLKSSGGRSLHSKYQSLYKLIFTSFAIEDVAENIKDLQIQAYYKYKERNWYARQVIPEFVSFLDHLAFHLYDVSLKRLLKGGEKMVSFRNLIRKKSWSPNIQESEIKQIRNVKAIASKNLTRQDIRTILLLRNCEQHRFSIGIDDLLRGTLSSFYIKKLSILPVNILFTVGENKGLHYHTLGRPLLEFGSLKKLFQKLYDNSNAIIKYLANEKLIISD